MTALTLLAVFIGGGAGATCRYGAGRVVGARYAGAFPLGTFLINVTGCFALGLVYTVRCPRRYWKRVSWAATPPLAPTR